ncbi:MAG: acetylhydrolase [Acetobacteraceae bacterium]|nr:acetylhydrolase [Acetobacteraceae bacterium]
MREARRLLACAFGATLAGVVPLASARLSAAQPPAAVARTPVPLAATPIARLDLPWWRERHEAVLTRVRSGRADLIFLGDSITENWEKRGPEPWRNFQPGWTRFYGDRNAVNMGFKGDTTASLLWRIRNGEVDGITPSVAIVLIGANNLGRVHWSAPDTVAGIDAILAELRRRLPTTKIILLAVLPSARSPWVTRNTAEINEALARHYAARPDLAAYIDLGALFTKEGSLDRSAFYDPLLTPPDPPLHPTAQTQERMAAAIEPTVARLMGDRNHLDEPR